MNIKSNITLKPHLAFTEDEGAEPSVGQVGNTVFYAANYFAAYSGDAGANFRLVNPHVLAKSVGLSFGGEQVTLFAVGAASMVWVLTTLEGPLLMCLSKLRQLDDSKGGDWTVYILSGPVFHRGENAHFGFPQLSADGGFLYLTFNLITAKDAMVCRFPNGHLLEQGTIYFNYFVVQGRKYVCPAQSTGDAGLFVTLNTTSQLRIFRWRDNQNKITIHDISISNIPNAGLDSWLPAPDNGINWLGTLNKPPLHVEGVTRNHQELWIAWTGGRRVLGEQKDRYPNPHIGIAIIDVASMKLIREKFIWNPEIAFAYPSLASNPKGDVALTCMVGGNRYHVHHVVGYLNGKEELALTCLGGIGGGANFITIRTAFPNIDQFVAAGDNLIRTSDTPLGVRFDPRYVVFKR